MNKIFTFTKVLTFNFFIFFFLIFIIEIFFGSWFKNNFKLTLSSERNINRAYKFDFTNHKGQSQYIRDNLGFRIKNKETVSEDVDVIFAGGSTINQKFLNYDQTIVGLLQKKINNLKLVNSGIDGMSIVGHINSFNLWYDKIDNFNPKYYIFFIGINDQYLFSDNEIRSIDKLSESSKYEMIREYLESNSFFYKKFRIFKTILFTKYNLDIGANQVNKKTKVYGERSDTKFISYKKFAEENTLNMKYQEIYQVYLEKLTNEAFKRNAKIIYFTQTSGNGMNERLYSISISIMNHCKSFNLICFNLAQELDLNSNDFYDWAHVNFNGSKKISDYFYKKLNKVFSIQ